MRRRLWKLLLWETFDEENLCRIPSRPWPFCFPSLPAPLGVSFCPGGVTTQTSDGEGWKINKCISPSPFVFDAFPGGPVLFPFNFSQPVLNRSYYGFKLVLEDGWSIVLLNSEGLNVVLQDLRAYSTASMGDQYVYDGQKVSIIGLELDTKYCFLRGTFVSREKRFVHSF